MPFVSQEQDRCTACNRIVYQTEKTIVEEKDQKKVYHKTCIRCAYDRCNKVLSLGQYSSIEGTFYCKPHFKQLFATKGNYEEGFGIEKEKKWDQSSPPVKPTSFVPVDQTSSQYSTEKKQTSDETAAKIRKFREDGENEKCTACARAVYATEKFIVEETGTKKPYHKSCLRCSKEGCGKQLDLGSYTSIDGTIFCKPHYQQLFKSKGNYDESFGMSKPENWKGNNIVTEKLSFIPKTEEINDSSSSVEKHKTSEATAEKIRKWREDSQSEVCFICSKSVFLAERIIVEEKNSKKFYHNSCFKCFQCDVKLDLRNYGSTNGKNYCLTHLKEVNSANNRPNVVATSSSFIPEVKEEKIVQKSETPSHIAEKFKGLGLSEKCKSCGKSVYATEKQTVEELKGQSIYHKNCFRCSKCSIQLDVSNMGSSSGVLYCKVHLKQFGQPELHKAEGAYFVSPLHNVADYQPQHETPEQFDNTKKENFQSLAKSSDNSSPEPSPKLLSPVQSPASSRRESLEVESEEKKETQNFNATEDERRKRREEREKQRLDEERKSEEEREKREKEREERRRSRNISSSNEDTDSQSDLEKRRREREERRKQQEEESKREEEEQQRKSEERRKRLEALRNNQ